MKLTECVIMDAKNITITQLDGFQAEILEAKLRYENLKKASGEAFGEMKSMQTKMIAILGELDRTGHKSKHGSVSFYYPERYKIENKEVFFKFLKDSFEPTAVLNMLTVNSQTLNSWAKSYVEEAEDSDGLGEVAIPGVASSTGDPIMSMRK